MGPHGPPSGGFRAFCPLIIEFIISTDREGELVPKLTRYSGNQLLLGAVSVIIILALVIQVFFRIISL